MTFKSVFLGINHFNRKYAMKIEKGKYCNLFLIAIKDSTHPLTSGDMQGIYEDAPEFEQAIILDALIMQSVLIISQSQGFSAERVVELQRTAMENLHDARKAGLLDIGPDTLRQSAINALVATVEQD